MRRLNRQKHHSLTAIQQTSTPHRLLLTKHPETDSPHGPSIPATAVRPQDGPPAQCYSARQPSKTSNSPAHAQPRLGIGYRPLVTITRPMIYHIVNAKINPLAHRMFDSRVHGHGTGMDLNLCKAVQIDLQICSRGKLTDCG